MSDVWRSLLALAITIPVIVISIHLLKRFSAFPTYKSKMLRLVAHLPIDNKNKLAIVETDDIQLVLAISASRIDVLHKTPLQAHTEKTNRKMYEVS